MTLPSAAPIEVRLYTSHPPEDPSAIPYHLDVGETAVGFALLDGALDTAGVRPGEVICEEDDEGLFRGLRFVGVNRERALGLAAVLADSLNLTEVTILGAILGRGLEATMTVQSTYTMPTDDIPRPRSGKKR